VKRFAKDRLFMATDPEILPALTEEQEFPYSGIDGIDLSSVGQRAESKV
jgi:hypothetical protein